MSAPASVGRASLIYGVGFIATRALTVLLFPIYTRFLSPADYGTLYLLGLTTEIAGVLFSAGATAGVMRFYFKYDDEERRARVVFTAHVMYALLNLAATASLLVAAPWIADVALEGGATPLLVRVAAVSFFLDGLTIVPLLLAQTRQRAALFAAVSLGRVVLQAAANLILLIGFGLGVLGLLLGSIVSAAVVAVGLGAWMVRQTGMRISWPIARELRRFGLPYQVMTAGTFIITFGDRFFLQRSHGEAAVGLYGLAYQFAFLFFSLAVMPVLRAWNPERLRLANEPREIRDRHYNEGFRWMNLVAVSVGVAFCAFVQPMLHVLTTEAFHAAALYIPILIAAYVVQGWGDVAQLSIDVSGQTRYASRATWLSVPIALALYATLIPLWGSMGAAVATLVACATRAGAMYYWGQRLWPVSWEWGNVLRVAAFGVAVSVASYALTPDHLAGAVATGTALVACYAAGVWTFALRDADRARIHSAVGSLPAVISARLART